MLPEAVMSIVLSNERLTRAAFLRRKWLFPILTRLILPEAVTLSRLAVVL